jgi:hypothetical protein
MEAKANEIKYGVLINSGISLTGPRMIDSKEYDTFKGAWDLAGEELAGGADDVTIVVARYDEAGEAWVEDDNYSANSIEIQMPRWSDPLSQEFPFEQPEEEDIPEDEDENE